ncbi:hypothetical protein GLP43_15100 [Sulfitobacter sp. M39]|uniref:hypothetical protein n=1 Tax=Sulfitobacter sp. M39 TaxID=2675334 RepID=UPI001F30D670|nr:hypothetical protein [Sulfitobacter sp. M39]MCF7748888.1 hypothetical protein [Sulfitobacter sp. M39]
MPENPSASLQQVVSDSFASLLNFSGSGLSGTAAVDQQALRAAALNDFTDAVATAINDFYPGQFNPQLLARTLAGTNAAVGTLLEVPEIAAAIANGEDVSNQISGAIASVSGAALGAEIAGALAGGIAATLIGPGVVAGAVAVAAAVLGAYVVGSLAESIVENLGGLFNPRPIDPLVIDLDGDGVELTSLETSNAYFDLDHDGFAENTGWVSGDDGLLAIDHNGNGSIDGIHELFGSESQTGYEQLASYDTNSDSQVDSQDTGFGNLLIWRDLNGNGLAEVGELTSLSATGISSIGLIVSDSNQTVAGNEIVETGIVTFSDGSTTISAEVLFDLSQINSQFVLPQNFSYNDDVFVLPYLQGFGVIPDSWVAMSMDTDLLTDSNAIIAAARAGIFVQAAVDFERLLFEQAGVENATWGTAEGDTATISAPRFSFLEHLMGQSFRGAGFPMEEQLTTILDSSQAADLNNAFEDVLDYYWSRFLVQAANTLQLQEGAGADLGSLAPFQNISLSASTDTIVGNFRALAVDLLNQEGPANYQNAIDVLSSLRDHGDELAAIIHIEFPQISSSVLTDAFGATIIDAGTASADTITANGDGWTCRAFVPPQVLV